MPGGVSTVRQLPGETAGPAAVHVIVGLPEQSGKTRPLPCDTAFALCVPTAFVAETLPLLCVFPLPSWLRHCLSLRSSPNRNRAAAGEYCSSVGPHAKSKASDHVRVRRTAAADNTSRAGVSVGRSGSRRQRDQDRAGFRGCRRRNHDADTRPSVWGGEPFAPIISCELMQPSAAAAFA